MQFDAAVSRLNRAIAGSSSEEVAGAFGEMAEAAAELSEAVDWQDRVDREAQERARSRGAA